MNVRTLTGPFGQYAHGSNGAVLNAICEIEGVPLTRVEHVIVGNVQERNRGAGSGSILDKKKVVANFRWFDAIDRPLFRWVDPDWSCYNEHRLIVSPDGGKKAQFRPTLCSHESPALEVQGELATPALFVFLKGMLTTFMDDPRYPLHKAAGAFFQGGYDKPKDKWFLFEFWKHSGVMPFIEYINQNYDPDKKVEDWEL